MKEKQQQQQQRHVPVNSNNIVSASQ